MGQAYWALTPYKHLKVSPRLQDWEGHVYQVC